MSKSWRWLYSLLAAVLVTAAGFALVQHRQQPAAEGGRLSGQVVLPAEGFSQADKPRAFTFPADHGPHPDFQTEWWYYTGNLAGERGERYGYQLTFFRRALAAPQDVPQRESGWAASQVYMAHFAVSDASRKTFSSYERLERGALGLAGAQGEPLFQVWLDDWSVSQQADGTFHLLAQQEDLALDLMMIERKPVVLQGADGLSQKGSQPGNASYYYSLTRLETNGTIKLPQQAAVQVSGWSWMDHEFSTSALSHGQIGWDWFALQLSDGADLMAFNLRNADGSPDPYSAGMFIPADGSRETLAREDFTIKGLDTWTSPQSGARYPSGWSLEVPSLGLSLEISPLFSEQENRLSFTYWEGAVLVTGKRGSQAVNGYGYVELTGYAASMENEF